MAMFIGCKFTSANLPMRMSLPGIRIDDSDEQAQKAYSPICNSLEPLSNSIIEMLEQSKKHPSHNVSTKFGITTSDFDPK
jgi:hypothetical protein